MLKIILVVCVLTEVRGGSNVYGLASYQSDEIGDILEVQGSAFETIGSKVLNYVKDKISPILPNYFKLGKLKKVDTEEKTIIIEASNKILVGNYRDGVAVNAKAARIIM